MSVAIRTAVRLQDQDDVNVTPAVGVDEYALTYDHDTGKFVLRAPAAPFDGTPYALLAGRAGGQTLYGGTAANDDLTIHGTSNGTRTTSYVLLQPSGGNVGIGTSAPDAAFHILGTGDSAYLLKVESTSVAHGYPGMFEVVCQDSLSDPQFKFHRATTGQGDFSFLVQGTGANNFLNIRSNHSGAPASSLVLQGSSGYVGVGLFTNVVLPATPLHVVSTTATTDALRNVLTLGANVTSTGVGAAGLGAAVLFQGETSTTVDSDMAQIGALWTTATHATRASALTFSTLTAGGGLTERMRIDGAGNVGIGTSAPVSLLHIMPASGATSIQLSRPTSTVQSWQAFDTANTPSVADPQYLFGFDQNVKYFQIAHWNGAALTQDLVISTTGLVGIGTASPATLLHVTSTTATTGALRNVLTLATNVTSTGVGAAGLGSAILFQAESTTTADTQQARIAALWYEATHATFKSDLVGYASDAAGEREIWRGRANGSAPAIGFLGATPQARIAHVADPAGGATVDAEARSAINSILATLENFGFHATS